MGPVFLIVLGTILGWLASIVMGQERSDEVLRNIVAGVGGALVVGLVVSPLVGAGSLIGGTYSIAALLLAKVGALAAIAGANITHLRRTF